MILQSRIPDAPRTPGSSHQLRADASAGRRVLVCMLIWYTTVPCSVGRCLEIRINSGPGLEANPSALNAFRTAAAFWELQLRDDVTVTVDADLADLGGNSIGRTALECIERPFDEVRDAMVADAMAEADDGIVAFLPTAMQLQVDLPAGVDPIDEMILTTANAKALGLDVDDPSLPDATITFNTQFSFDYDNSDGVDPQAIDFETAAVHELAHVLGFVSHLGFVEAVLRDNLDEPVQTATLDLFRFASGTPGDPATPEQFRVFPRSLRPGEEAALDFLVHGQFPVSTGIQNGDGRQGSHWKDDEFTGNRIGVMDPSITKGEVVAPNEADMRALDLIGWDIALDAGPALRAGDADQDLDFDQLDLVRVQIAGKYLSGQHATWGEGDWDGAPGGSQGRPSDGDRRFDQKDIVNALQGGAYLTGAYSALGPLVSSVGVADDERTSIVYNAATGEVSVQSPRSEHVNTIGIFSEAGIFVRCENFTRRGSVDQCTLNEVGDYTFDNDTAFSFGEVARTGVSREFLLSDLTVAYALGGPIPGETGTAHPGVDLIYVPEPPSGMLFAFGGTALTLFLMGIRAAANAPANRCPRQDDTIESATDK